MEPKIIVVRYRKACDCPTPGVWNTRHPLIGVKDLVPAIRPPEEWEASGKEYTVTFAYDPFVVCGKCDQPWQAELQQTA
jgi:hypothetical protein